MPEQFIENFSLLTDKEIKPNCLKWNKPSQNILVIKKINDIDVNRAFIKVISWLVSQKRKVFIENHFCQEFSSNLNSLENFKDNLFKFVEESHSKIDLIITIGGDGTYLYACSLFQSSIPPIMPFHLGSLGFLTRFSLENFESSIQRVWNGEAKINYRSRLLCKVIKNDNNFEIGEKYLVLNDIVIDRGLHPFLSNVDLFINDHYITTLQGDGLIIATPTGSTAYSAAAGASMIHPSVPGIVITPICPHSLSFRPIVVPPHVVIKIKIAPESRNSGFVCLDGRHRQELKIGDTLQITSSEHSVPSLILDDETQEWFDSLIKCLRWNDREKQKPFH